MWTRKIVLIFLSTICFSSAAQTNSTVYSIVAHGKLVPNSVYSVVFDINGNVNKSEIFALIHGKTDENDTVSINSSVTVEQSGTSVIELNTTNLKDGEYSLNVSAKGGIQFNHHTKLFLESKRLSVFVQTDKAMYKPGQIVRFRVAAVHQNLLAAFSEKVRSEVHDSNGNVIQVFNGVINEIGIVSHEFQLSEEPVLGDWVISGSIANQRFTKSFQIAEYVLPVFDVQISAPTNIIANQSDIVIEVKASYTYGKPVKGDMQLFIRSAYSYPKQTLYELYSIIKGQKTVNVLMKHIVRKRVHYSNAFDVEVSVKDYLTGKVYNKSHHMTVYENSVVFTILNENHNFKYGMDYVLYIKALDNNNQIIEVNNTPVSVYYGFGYDNYDKKIDTTINNGIIKVVIDTNPPQFEVVNVTSVEGGTLKVRQYNENSSISIQVEYQNKNTTAGTLYTDRNIGDCFAQLRVDKMTRMFETGEDMVFVFDSNIPIKDFNYQIISKKGILLSKNEKKSEASKQHLIKLKTTHEMTPKSRVIVHFMCNNAIAVDAVEFQVTGALRTKVNISALEVQVKPSSNVSITFNTHTPSLVHILAIDQKMLLLKSGNDIEIKNVESEIEKYVGCNGDTYFSSCVRHHWYYWNSQRNVFTSSGLNIFSSFINDTEYQIYPVYRGSPAMAAYGGRFAMEDDSEVLTTTPAYGKNSFRRGFKMRSRFQSAEVRVRQYFPETWLWETLQTKENGKITITRTVPDTITSWFISGFAINNATGFGLTDHSIAIKVIRKFFVILNIPYSIIRGETVIIDATIFNYGKKAKNVTVTLEKTNKFVFNSSDNQNKASDLNDPQMKSITVEANDGVTVSFRIIAKKLGFVDIKVTALGDGHADSVSEKLLVKPEGETINVNHATLISLNNETNAFSKNFKVEIPKDYVHGSQKVWVTVIGDILGTVVNNIDKLLQVPCGCGEQNMVNFVPNVVVLEYLTKANKLTKQLKVKALTNIQTGYQRQLAYRHYDGSFSAFGVGDTNGSTWLTAFVVKSFIQAKPYIHIDRKVLNRSITFLFEQQTENGCFIEHGTVINKAMQSGTSDGKGSLTAYVLIALTLSSNKSKEISDRLRSSLDYLSNLLQNSTDIYEIAIITYAFHLSDHQQKDNGFKKLMEFANKTDNYIHWNRNNSKGDYNNDVEITAYALQTLLLRNETEISLAAIRWLISKQNCFGGFSNTQNTVIAIEGLAKFAAKFPSDNIGMNIKIEANNKSTSLQIDNKDTTVLREVILPKNTKSINITASGSGTATVQVSWKYNRILPKSLGFTVNHTFEEKLNTSFKIKICVHDAERSKSSGMVLIDMILPSGYIADVEWLNTIITERVKKTEVKQENTQIVVYIDELENEQICVLIAANRMVKVENLKLAPISVYDYYNNGKKTTLFYTL